MSGLSRTPGKRVGTKHPPRVRIPPSPPNLQQLRAFRAFFSFQPIIRPIIRKGALTGVGPTLARKSAANESRAACRGAVGDGRENRIGYTGGFDSDAAAAEFVRALHEGPRCEV